MRIMGILALLVGGLEGLNVMGDLRAGGQAARTGPENFVHLAAAVAAIALIAAGAGLLFAGQRSAKFASASALVCLVLFAAIAAFFPALSIVARLLGLIFPIALIVFLRRTSARRTSPSL
jgi:hypothetical protein